MSKRTEQRAADMAAPMSEAAAAAEVKTAALADFIQAHPAAKGLLVSVGRFAQVRSNLGRSGTAEAILFQKIKSEL